MRNDASEDAGGQGDELVFYVNQNNDQLLL
jgi:hypothetical protein